MRILLTADPLLPVPPKLYGGIERIIDALALELQKRGHRVGLLAHAESTCSVERLAWPALETPGSWAHLSNALALRQAVKSYQPDLVHSFSRLFYLIGILSSRLPKIMSYQRLPTPRTVFSAWRLSKNTLRFTGCSGFICREGQRGGGRWEAIPNFVNVDAYQAAASVPPDAPLVFLSRIEAIKGAHRAIAIARQAKRRLLLAGNHATDGEAGRYWKERIEPALGHDGIDYVGPVDDHQKNELLGRAAALIVPVEWDEPFGIVFAEALACGTPVISCPRGALPEIVRPGVDGFLIRTDREGVEAVESLAQIDRLGCRRRAVERFSAAAAVDRYEHVYRDAVAQRLAA